VLGLVELLFQFAISQF